MPSIKSLKSDDFIALQQNLYKILEIVSKHEGIMVEASYPLRDIKQIIDNIGETNLGMVARDSESRARHGRSHKNDVMITYKQKLEMAIDPNNKDYSCCERCGEPMSCNSMWVHKQSAKCQYNYNRIKVGRCIKKKDSKLIDLMIPIISDLEEVTNKHTFIDYRLTPYYLKYGKRKEQYSIEVRIGYGPPGYRDSDREYTPYYDTIEEAETIGMESISDKLYERHCERARYSKVTKRVTIEVDGESITFTE